MNSTDKNPPLANDPAREAVASIRGYVTQIWRSVLEWITLGEDERLYLEGAEDIDRVQGSQAEAIQVKDVQGNITLRSLDAIEAINNAFAHRQRNPTRRIRFRFLTTGGIGREKGSSFRDELTGIGLWRSARASADEARREADTAEIAKFLLAEGKVSSAVQHFLRTSSVSDIWSGLIEVIEWDTNAEGSAGVVKEIEDHLVEVGQLLGVPANESEKVAAHLCATALETATREKDRYLTHADFLRLFNEQTHISMPKATANALLAAVPSLFSAIKTPSLPIAIGKFGPLIGRPPPLPQRYFSRENVLATIEARLRKSSLVLVQGGTGVGKTVTAIGHAAKSTTTWSWVSLRDLKDAQLESTLGKLADELAAEQGITHLVLDDLEVSLDAHPLEKPLHRILSLLEERSGRLIVTSTQLMPQRLRLALNLDPEGILSVAPFQQSEIQDFLLARHCPEKSAEAISFFIHLHTGGHAQLVHARVAALEVQGFPAPEIQTALSTPPEVNEARAEARKLIKSLAENERELIYRLSLTVGALPRKQILAIALRPPPIAEPGHALDALIGPWLETISDGVLRASPLVKDLARDVQGDDWVLAMHSEIAAALLQFRTLSPSDVSTILFHAVAGREWSAVARLALGIMTADEDVWKALASNAGWFVLVATEPGTQRPETDPLTLLVVRLLQFRLAVALADDKRLLLILQRLDEEVPSNVSDTPLRLSRYIFLAQALSQTDVRLPISVIARIGVEYLTLTDKLTTELRAVEFTPDLARWLSGPDGNPDKVAIAGFSLATAIVDTATLRQVLDVAENLPEAGARRLLWVLGGHETVAAQILNRVWLAETKQNDPNWEECRAQLQRAYAVGRRYQLPGLVLASAITDSRILHENLKNPAAALALLATAAEEIGSPPPLDDQRAVILLQSDPAAALEIWRKILPAWTPQDELDLQPPFSCRLAAIAAARLDLWQESADWLARARDLAPHEDQIIFRAGLFMDEGFARWRSGNNLAALACFDDAFRIFNGLDSAEYDKSYLTRRLAAHTLMWVANKQSGELIGTTYSAPLPGACSLPNPLTEPDGPRSPPLDAMLSDILKFEFASDLGDRLFKEHEATLCKTPYGLVRLSFNQLRMRRRLQSLSLDDFVAVAADRAIAATICSKYYREGGLEGHQRVPDGTPDPMPDLLEPELLLAGLAEAVIALTSRGKVEERVLQTWRETARELGILPTLDAWLTFVENLFISDTINASDAVRDQKLSWIFQLTASVRVAIDDATRPNELLTIHQYWVGLLRRVPLLVLSDIEHLVSKGWQVQSERPFLLSAPTMSVPALRKACASSAKGWRKIGEVLSAACDAVPGPLPITFRGLFESLVREE